MIESYRGRWDATKKPSAWDYEISLQCAICGVCQVISGTTTTLSEGATVPIGTWRTVAAVDRGHANPLAEGAVVCSRGCADRFVSDALDAVFA